jgi:hypothetical protein
MRARSLFLQAWMTYCIILTKTHDSGSLNHIDKISYNFPLSDLPCTPISWTKALRYSRDQRGEMLAYKIHGWKKRYVSHNQVCFPFSRTRSSAHSTYSYFLSWLLLLRLILLLQRHYVYPHGLWISTTALEVSFHSKISFIFTFAIIWNLTCFIIGFYSSLCLKGRRKQK